MVYDSISSTGPVFDRFGIWGFVTGARWSPSFTIYGALPFIYGTLLTGLIAVVLAVPIAIGIALLVTEFLPRRVAGPVAIVVDLLAAVPSVVWGLWGLLVLVPFLRPFEQAVAGTIGRVLPFLGPPTPGPSYFAAGLVVAFMIIPIVAAVTREVFAGDAAAATGGDPGPGRNALGRDPAGRDPDQPDGPLRGDHPGARPRHRRDDRGHPGHRQRAQDRGVDLRPGFTLASVIANEFNEATEELHPEALIALGVVLLVIAVVINGGGVLVRRRFEQGLQRGR